MLNEHHWLDPREWAEDLAREVGCTRMDATRACRQQRGILFAGATVEQASNAIAVLDKKGVSAAVIDDSDVPVLPKPLDVGMAQLDGDMLGTPSLTGIGVPQIWAFDDIRMIVAGIIMDPESEAAGTISRLDQGFLDDASDRKVMAERHLQKVGQRAFPLREELERKTAPVLEAIQSAFNAKTKSKKKKANETAEDLGPYGRYRVAIDVFMARPLERLRFSEQTRIKEIGRQENAAQSLVTSLGFLVERAAGAFLPVSAEAVLDRRDSALYLFESETQFDDYCRWCWWSMLRNEDKPTANDDEE